MDVRCDRCQTEYELDDAIVTEAGASVQCSTCGHTFYVRPGGVTAAFPAPVRDDASSAPDAPEWTLRTEDGKVHRFRDFNTLQRWIVERKVTRDDRVSRLDGPWQALGAMPELVPFFAVVEEADRARVATSIPAPEARPRDNPASGMAPTPVAPLAMPGVTAPSLAGLSAQGGVGPAAAPRAQRFPEDGPTEPNRRLPPVPAAAMGVRNTVKVNISPSTDDGRVTEQPGSSPEDFSGMDYLPVTHRGRNAVLFVLALGIGGGGGYWWWDQQNRGASPSPQTEVARPAPAAIPTGPPSAAVGEVPSAAPVEAVTGTRASGSSPSAPDGAAQQAAASAPEAPAPSEATQEVAQPATDEANAAAKKEEPVAVTAPPGPTKAQDARTGGKRSDASKRSPALPLALPAPALRSSYESWVAEGDRAIARRNVAKADKFYAQALAMRPDGVAALTGSAYVLLDRQRHFKAIETFRRALAINPNYGPALFGIAESYRARGDAPQALLAYRQYLAMSPAGAEAPAARRQIKDLSADDDTP